MLMSRKRRNFAHMIEIERHIEILLLSNDCVIVPGLGGFMAHHMAARYDEGDGLFLSPLRTLGFNPQLQLNDHLLVQSYIEAYDISYPEALRRIEEEVSELKLRIEAEGEYELNDIGLLRLNNEGHYEFEPCEAGILTPEFYGLSTFEMPLFQREEKAVEKLLPSKPMVVEMNQNVSEDKIQEEAEATDHDEDTLVIRMSWIRNIAAAAAAVVAFFIISNPVSNSGTEMSVQQSSVIPAVASIDNLQKVGSRLSESVSAPATDECADVFTKPQTPVASEAVSVESHEPVAEKQVNSESYTIVLASHTPMKHAEEFIGRLEKKGFKQAGTMEIVSSSKVRVIYGSYASETDAQNELQNLRRQDNSSFREAWVMKVKQ